MRKAVKYRSIQGKEGLLFFVFGLLILLGIIFNFNSFTGYVADSIIHPLLGEKNTLFLESIYFGIEDKLNQIQYKYIGKNNPSFTKTAISTPTKLGNVDQMDLNPFSLDLSLPKVSGEGAWVPISQTYYSSQVVIARSFIRPDITRPYATAFLVKMDMKKLGISVQAGTYYPGGTHKAYGPGVVPKNILVNNSLLAVFNGGFQEKDGHYGMIVGNKTYVPLRKNIPTLFFYANGSFSLVTYTGQEIPKDVVAVRQNGPFLIENGRITSYVELGSDTWGRTITNNMYTWRSGLGITKEGNLIYAVGNSLIPNTLAKALLAAGAVNAMQLDINSPWVRFIIYQSIGNGKYSYAPLLTSMTGGKEYLTRYNKDFFYVYKK